METIFFVSRQRTFVETYVVKAKDLVDARSKDLVQERLLSVEPIKTNDESLVAWKAADLDCEEGERIYEVDTEESVIQKVLVVASNREEAKEKALEGEGFSLHKRQFSEISDPNSWDVRDWNGEQAD